MLPASLNLPEQLNAESLAMDSMTVYRGMDIGTRQTHRCRSSARSAAHLIDVLDPWESGNVAWWLDEAARCVQDIEQRGKQALFVGGTPFYLKALLFGLFDAPPHDPALRRRLEEEAAALGAAALHARLAAIDAMTAKRLHPNDVRRVVRALEVWHLTGKPLSECQQQGWWRETTLLASAEAEGRISPGDEVSCKPFGQSRDASRRTVRPYRSACRADDRSRLARRSSPAEILAQTVEQRSFASSRLPRIGRCVGREKHFTGRTGSDPDEEPAIRQTAVDVVPQFAGLPSLRRKIDIRSLA